MHDESLQGIELAAPAEDLPAKDARTAAETARIPTARPTEFNSPDRIDAKPILEPAGLPSGVVAPLHDVRPRIAPLPLASEGGIAAG